MIFPSRVWCHNDANSSRWEDPINSMHLLLVQKRQGRDLWLVAYHCLKEIGIMNYVSFLLISLWFPFYIHLRFILDEDRLYEIDYSKCHNR